MSLQITETAILEGVRWDAESRRGSVLDVVKLVNQCTRENASHLFQRLSNDHPYIVSDCTHLQFPGKGQRATPVAPLKTLVEIAWLFPGKRAAEFRRAGAATMCRVLGGDLSLVDEIRERHGAIGSEERAAWLEGVETGGRAPLEWNPRKIISDAMDKLDGAKDGLDEAGLRALVDMTSLLVRTVAAAPWSEPSAPADPPALPPGARLGRDVDVLEETFASLVRSGGLVVDPARYIPLDVFRQVLREHAVETGIVGLSARDTQRPTLDPLLARHGLTRFRDALPYGGRRLAREYVVGADVRA